MLRVGGQIQFRRVIDDPNGLHMERIVSALQAIDYLETHKAASVGTDTGGESEKEEAQKTTDKMANFVVSMLSSITGVVRMSVKAELVSEQTKIAIAKSMIDLMAKFDIDAKTVENFRKRRATQDTDPALLSEILRVFPGSRS